MEEGKANDEALQYIFESFKFMVATTEACCEWWMC